MVEERGSSHNWSLYLAVSGLLLVLMEVSLGAAFLEQVLSHSPLTLHHATSLFCLFTSLIVAPIPLFIIQKRCKSLRSAMLGLGADEGSISSLERTMGEILIVSYAVLNSCVVALARLS